MNRIEITRLEMSLILEEIHPEYKSDFEDEYLERGKGADVHYERKVIRLSDNKELKIGFTHNSEVGFQDWIRTGDFELNHDKEDIYDCYGELIQKEEVKEEVDEKEKEPSQEDIHNKLVESGEIKPFQSDDWLNTPIEKLMSIYDMVSEWYKNPNNNIGEIGTLCFKIGIEEKVHAERLWAEIFQNRKLCTAKISRKRIEDYFTNRKALVENPDALMTQTAHKDVERFTTKYYNKN